MQLKDPFITSTQYNIYPLNQTEPAEFKKQITELFKEKKIRVFDSLYGASNLFAKNKDGQLYLCIDYCDLKKKTPFQTPTYFYILRSYFPS